MGGPVLPGWIREAILTARRQTRLDIETAIREKSARDEAFRAQLIADPKGVLEREVQARSGRAVRFPRTLTVTVHEETPDHIHLVIPGRAATSGEIADVDLEQAAGGTAPYPLWGPVG